MSQEYDQLMAFMQKNRPTPPGQPSSQLQDRILRSIESEDKGWRFLPQLGGLMTMVLVGGLWFYQHESVVPSSTPAVVHEAGESIEIDFDLNDDEGLSQIEELAALGS